MVAFTCALRDNSRQVWEGTKRNEKRQILKNIFLCKAICLYIETFFQRIGRFFHCIGEDALGGEDPIDITMQPYCIEYPSEMGNIGRLKAV